MTTYTVLLEDGTTGTLNSDTLDGQPAEAFVGENVTVRLHDSNGNPVEHEGKLLEVLEGA